MARQPTPISESVPLAKVISIFEKVAPKRYAESWDNVGLLLEPSDHKVKKVLVTNDLTLEVLEEAVNAEVDLIYSYHPPLFKPLKSLTQDHWKSQILVKCLENRIAIYSPHTALDVVHNGINDWLMSCFDVVDPAPIKSIEERPSRPISKITIDPAEGLDLNDVKFQLTEFKNITIDGPEGDSKLCITPSCGTDSEITSWLDEHKISYTPQFGLLGAGRYGTLKEPILLKKAIEMVKMHISVPCIRLAIKPREGKDMQVRSVAVCAGSGSSILMQCPPVDLMVTGEMSHHDALELTHRGCTVLLCEHSNSERGFFTPFCQRLRTLLPSHIEVNTAKSDRDPLIIV